jgi:endonuclease/exonuclease/phosphatase (EEP) superfamily protein YafD
MLPLDHVFVRGLDVSDAAAGVVAAEPMPSDHRPVWAIFQP